MKHIIFENKNYRILECPDESFSLDDLKGDIYNPKFNPEIDAETLKAEELKFDDRVFNEGVFGYILEKKCPTCGNWEEKDSCWGFIGQNELENHYIINEFMKVIRKND